MPDRPPLSSSISALSLATILSLGGPLAGSAAIAVVSTSNDAGPGSFRDAIAMANGNASITQIVFLPSVNTIELQATVFFTGWQDLVIDGNNAILDGRNAGGTAFVVSGGGDLSVSDLTVQNAPAEGITYAVPGGATGTLHIVLDNVTIQDNVGHGVWIADQVDNSAPEGEQPPDAGSDVSLDVTVIDSRFLDNGNDPDRSESDHDGLRVDEGERRMREQAEEAARRAWSVASWPARKTASRVNVNTYFRCERSSHRLGRSAGTESRRPS